MRIKLGVLKKLIKETLSGGLRKVKPGRQQYKIGKVEDENRELSSSEAEMLFPGSTNAWAEVVPSLFPDFLFDDPFVIKKKSVWFKEGNELKVAFEEAPQITLASWDPFRDDWIETEFAG
jgi:hypothetical protein